MQATLSLMHSNMTETVDVPLKQILRSGKPLINLYFVAVSIPQQKEKGISVPSLNEWLSMASKPQKDA